MGGPSCIERRSDTSYLLVLAAAVSFAMAVAFTLAPAFAGVVVVATVVADGLHGEPVIRG